ncbi:hypothetical protein [Methylocystis silviterrae]|uniref:hypothetical protein n=1 Tax=Methylocystis silviterrae TaxID=2743612 RepID=UPI002FC2922E
MEEAAPRAWAAALQAWRRPAAGREAAALRAFAPQAAVLPASEEPRAAEEAGPRLLTAAALSDAAPAAAERAQGKAASASGAEPGAAGRLDSKLLVRLAAAGEAAAAQQASEAPARRGQAAD